MVLQYVNKYFTRTVKFNIFIIFLLTPTKFKILLSLHTFHKLKFGTVNNVMIMLHTINNRLSCLD